MPDTFITVRNLEGAVVVQIQEPYLDNPAAADILRSELARVVSEHQPQVLVLDLSQVKMMASSAIGGLLRIHHLLQDYQGQLRLCAVPVFIREVCRSLNLEGTVFHVFNSAEEAARARVIYQNEEREIMED